MRSTLQISSHCQIPLKMAEEIEFENRRISNFQQLVALTLTLNWVIWHTTAHQSLTYAYTPKFIQIGKTF